jgi:cell division protein FtsB
MTLAQLVKLRQLFGTALWPAMAIMLLLAFVAYAIFGPNGILAWGDYSRQLAQRQAELAQLKAHEAALDNRVKLLDPKQTDPDLAEELVRKQLGVTHPDDVVLLQK